MGYEKKGLLTPSRGTALFAAVDTVAPGLDAIKQWWDGARTGALATAWNAVGYTSADALPKIASDSEGGETRDVFEVAAIMTTPIKTKDTVDIEFVQWTSDVLKHRFGADGKANTGQKSFEVPDSYKATETAMLLIFADPNGLLCVYYPRMTSSPNGGIEPDGGKFLGAGVRYTRLASTTGKKVTLIGDGLAA